MRRLKNGKYEIREEAHLANYNATTAVKHRQSKPQTLQEMSGDPLILSRCDMSSPVELCSNQATNFLDREPRCHKSTELRQTRR